MMSPRLLAVWLAAVGCAVWLWAGGCAPAAVICWPLPCALWAFACWLLPVVGCLAGLLAVGSAPVLCWRWWRLSGCALLGGYGGLIYQAPRDYPVRVKPLPAWLTVPLAVCFCRFHRRGTGGHRWPPRRLARSRWWSVFLKATPGDFLALASCLLARFGGQRSTPSATERPTEPPTENAEKTRRIFRPSCRTVPAGPDPGRAPAPRWPPCRRSYRRPPKISSDFPGEVFYAPGLSLDSWYINAPL